MIYTCVCVRSFSASNNAIAAMMGLRDSDKRLLNGNNKFTVMSEADNTD